MVDRTLEAFGMTVEEMKEANRQAAEQMLPVPYDIPGEVGPTEEKRFGDTAAWAAKDSWEEAKSRFQARGTQEGVAGGIPDADSSVLNTFATGLGYAADMGLSGLAASDAAWRYSVGLASELIPGMDKNQERRFTRDVSSIPEAFAGNVTGVVGGIDRLPDVRQATTGARVAAEDVLDAMPEYDPNRVNIFGGLGARDPGYDRTGRPLPESVGSDGMYRFEVDDSGSVAIPGNLKTFSGLNSEIPNLPEVADVFIHDELFDQYPSVRNIRIGLDDSLGSTTRGYFDSNRNLIAVNKDIGMDPKKLRSTLTHELQHFVQEKEGFASGSSLGAARKTPQAIEIQRQQTEIADAYNRAVAEKFKPEKVINRLGEISQGLLDAVEYYGGDVARAIENPMSLKFNYDIPFIISYSFRRLNEAIYKAQDNLVPGFSEKAIQQKLLGSIDTDLNSLGRDLARTIPEEVPLGPLKGFADDFRSLYARFGSKSDRDLSTDQMMELREGASRIVSKFLGLPEKPKSFFDPAFEAYRRAGGEVESRNTQNRIDFDEARRFRETPESTEDVPRELQYNPREFNEGGLAMERQMNTMMAEGGIKDDGMDRDPISGNEIPAGSLAKEVRDDVDAKLSEGEYVVPADVVRYFGVNYFEKLRQKAKAGLEEMDRDGRIGGDPVEEQMGSMMDDDLPFSDEELMSIDDEAPIGMNEGGDVSALASSGFNPAAFRPGFSFGLPGSGQGATTGLPSETKTFVNAQGEIRSILFINGQPIQQIPAGFVEDTPENRANFQESVTPPSSSVESTSSRDRDRSVGVQTPQSTSERKSGYSLSEDQVKSLSEDPFTFGQDALKGNLFTGKTLGTVGAMINPALGLLGVGIGTYNEMQGVAAARSALKVMEDRKLTDTAEYRQLASDLKAREKDLSFAAKGLDSLMDFSGETGAAAVIRPDPAPMTPQAIPTAVVAPTGPGPAGSTRSTTGAGITYDTTVSTSKDRDSGRETTTEKKTIAPGTSAAPTKSYKPISKPTQPSTTTSSNQSKPSTSRSASESRAAAQRAADRGGRQLATGGRAKGGLVERPKKKPVAKK